MVILFVFFPRVADGTMWKEEGSAIISPNGGEVSAGGATIVFPPGTLKQPHAVRLQHQRPFEREQSEDVLIRMGEEEGQLGDQVVLSFEKLEPTGAQQVGLGVQSLGAAPESSDVAVDILVHAPLNKPNAELYARSRMEGEEVLDYRRVTDSAGLKLVEYPQGETHLTFNPVAAIAGFASKAASTVYEVVWLKSKDVANKARSAVAQYLASDNEPLHIRVHYRCDQDGYPCRLQTVIASGPPPQHADKCDDGWYTAHCVAGEINLTNKFISCRDHIRVQIEPFNPTPTWKMTTPNEYTFTKPPRETNCHYYFHGMGLLLDQVQSTAENKWEVMITVVKNGDVERKGNSVLLIRKQVRRLHVCQRLSKLCCAKKSPSMVQYIQENIRRFTKRLHQEHSESLTPYETFSKKLLWPTVMISWHLS